MPHDAPKPEDALDERLSPIGAFVAALSIAAAPTGNSALDATMHVERLSLELPCELQLVEAPDGGLRLGGAPPTQQIETTVMPVFHRIVVTVVRNSDAPEGAGG